MMSAETVFTCLVACTACSKDPLHPTTNRRRMAAICIPSVFHLSTKPGSQAIRPNTRINNHPNPPPLQRDEPSASCTCTPIYQGVSMVVQRRNITKHSQSGIFRAPQLGAKPHVVFLRAARAPTRDVTTFLLASYLGVVSPEDGRCYARVVRRSVVSLPTCHIHPCPTWALVGQRGEGGWENVHSRRDVACRWR